MLSSLYHVTRVNFLPSILIVDDEETVRATFQDVLEAEGHEVVTASSFTEAKERLEAKRFDAALTDLMLPQESGLSLLRYAAERDETMSVVMVTGHPDLSTAVEALKEGAYDYITKPVSRRALLVVVERACERNTLPSREAPPRSRERRLSTIAGRQGSRAYHPAPRV